MNYLPVFIVIVLLSISYLLGLTPLLVLAIYVIGLLTFAAYAQDKRAAQNGNWRVSERTLHIFSILCGWPGAIIAQQKLRHKTKKTGFRVAFWFTVLVNSGALAWIHTSEGSADLRMYLSKMEGLVINEVGNLSIRSKLLTLLRFRAHL